MSTVLPAIGELRGALLLTATLLAYETGVRLQRRLGGNALANPVLIAVVLISGALRATGISGSVYMASVQPLALLLAPATVGLALPLYRNFARIRQAIVPILIGVTAGALVAAGSAVSIAMMLGAPPLVLHSIAPKSVTAAISMSVAREIGGDPQLAAAFAVLTGISGAMICTRLFDLAGVLDPRARGLAAGVTAHGIATARMLTESPEAGAFSGLAMGLAGFVVGAALPIIARWLPGWAH